MFAKLFSKVGKSQSAPDVTALQNAAVRSVVGDIADLIDGEWGDREWVYLAINHEISAEEAQRSSSQAAVLARQTGADLEKLNFRLSPASKQALLALRDAMTTGGKAVWTVADLTIARDGRYDFSFSYEPPPRINGNVLHSPLTGLLERYLHDRPDQR